MFKNKSVVIISIVAISLSVVFFVYRLRTNSNGEFTEQEIHPVVGDIRLAVMTTGVVEPQNRLEIKPSMNGRVEEILVDEGDKIRRGQILARMSSTERAALVDAARSQGDEALEYWEKVYKEIPIISPIDGEVIVRSIEPGQTVTTNDALLVLSDRLIVKAQFDETDIGRVSVGQEAVIALDAYPNVKIKGIVDHIAYESELINNVTIYDVDILPEKVPAFFRSGMSANVEVVEKEREGVMLIPVKAIHRDQGRTYVEVRKKPENTIEKRIVEIGLSDERNAEVVSGLTNGDVVVVQSQTYSAQNKPSGTNPFLPFGRGRKK
jgi:macrolide-specific efflux system membrane fusion protein